MNRFVAIEGTVEALETKFRYPTSVMWNRLEGRPRRTDFSRALKAEVRDPLWMIARQAQLGEYIGDDAASPVAAKVAWTTDTVNRMVGRNGAVEPYDGSAPLEAVIEALPVPLSRAGRIHNADLRLALGRRWHALLDRNGLGIHSQRFRTHYGFTAPDPVAKADFPLTAAAANWQFLAAIAGRAIDGGALLEHLSPGGTKASDDLGFLEPDKSRIDSLGDSFLAWANRLYFQPNAELESWNPRHLEYSVGLSAPSGGDKAALAAAEYHGGRLDWFHFDVAPPGAEDLAGAASPVQVTSFVPVPVQFEGMPNTRHWAFEEGVTNFGDIKPDTTDIAKLLLIEFGLVFANDWFLLPLDLPVGSLTRVRGLAVTNVFGERVLIEPAVTSAGPLQSWQMFRLTDKGASDDRLFLPTTAPPGLESAAVEAVDFVRDEVSNMVWGLERIVQTADGASRPGREVALELNRKFQSAVPPADPADTAGTAGTATITYKLMNSVAEHWIPFVPIHVPDDNREIQLQRAAMPRLLAGEQGIAPEKIRPRTALLREGLDAVEPTSYLVAEEEVERAGTVVETRWQRCRWADGNVILWLGHRRMVGRGEASSGLAFDLLVPTRKS